MTGLPDHSPAVLSPSWHDRPRTIAAHRADLDGEHVPNSAAAIEACVLAGAPRIEIDLRFLSDGTMAVFHDEALDDETDAAGAVQALDAASLANVRYRGGNHPPVARFEECLDLVRGSGTTLHVDLKHEGLVSETDADALVGLLAPFGDQVIVGAQEHWNLRLLAAHAIPVAFDPTQQWHHWPDRPALDGWSPARLGQHGLWDDAPIAHLTGVADADYIASRVGDIAALLPAAREWMVDIHTIRHIGSLGVPLGEALRPYGARLVAWTVQDRGPRTGALLQSLFDAGVDVVIADAALQVGGRLDGDSS